MAPLPLRFRHLILQFGHRIKTYVPKNKNKIKVIPHQGKWFLNKDILTAWPHLPRETALFFCVLCRKGDLPSSNLA